MASDVEKFIRFCESEFGRRLMQLEAEYAARELSGCAKVLDVGCGIGSLEERSPHIDIVGLDNSPEMLDEARKRSNKPFILGNAENLDFPDSYFDAVVYIATLEFVDNYQKAIQEASRVTKPNGRLLLMILNSESEYFHEHIKKIDSYFRMIKHTELGAVRRFVSGFYDITKEEYFLGVKGHEILETYDRRFASLYVIVAKKSAN